MNVRRRGPVVLAAALIALLMLSYASVQSVVMQVAMSAAAAQPLCGGSADPAMAAAMDMGAASPMRSPGGVTRGTAPAKTCPYCIAAAHVPIVGVAAPWRAPSAFTFAAFRVVSSHGPRGPPARLPRARGPPLDPLIL